jgi:hypothetical protein
MDLAGTGRRLLKFASDNSPAILTSAAVVGTITTAYLTGKASFKAADVIRDEEDKRGIVILPPREQVEMTWKLFVPAISTGALTIACIICANRIADKRAAAMVAAYSVLDRAFEEYKAKVVEKIGDRKEEAVRDELAQDRVRNNPPVDKEVVFTDRGNVLFLDEYSGRYFRSSVQEIKSAEIAINHTLISDYSASLTDFYHTVGLRPTKVSDELGWNSSDGRLLEIKFSTAMTETDEPCIVLVFAVEPIRGYYRIN